MRIRPRSHLVALKPDQHKIVEAIAFVIAEGARRKVPVTQYDVVKTLFLADKAHLNKYGRPVTFDNYCAMYHGPVPSLAYNLLKGWVHSLDDYRIDVLPWESRMAPEIGNNVRIYCNAKAEWDDDVLSPSDIEALQDALTTIKSLSFGQIRRLTHQDPAYVEAWGAGESRNSLMSYGLLFDSPDFEQAEVVKYLSESRASIDR